MFREVICVALLLPTITPSGAGHFWRQQSGLPMITVSHPPGTRRAAMQARMERYVPGQRPPIVVNLYLTRDVHDEKGIVVSGFGFYGWVEGKAVRLRVFAMVPGPGAPNRYLADESNARALLVARDFADLTIAVGKTIRIDAMKRWGIEPMEVRVDAKSPRS